MFAMLSTKRNWLERPNIEAPFMYVHGSAPGLPDLFLVHDAKTGKIYQMNTKCTKWA
jgi:hypothetical protein